MPAQYADPSISRRKFEREIAEYRALEDEYRRRGWFMLKADFPHVLVILAAAAPQPPFLVMGVKLDYTNYDAAPPSVRLVHPFTGEPYKHKELPNPLNRALPAQALTMPGLPEGQKVMVGAVQPYMQAYGPDDVPFLCLAGVREYHEHPAHNGDLWELHRAGGAGRLVRLLDIIYRYGVAPITGYDVQLIPQVRLSYGQAPS